MRKWRFWTTPNSDDYVSEVLAEAEFRCIAVYDNGWQEIDVIPQRRYALAGLLMFAFVQQGFVEEAVWRDDEEESWHHGWRSSKSTEWRSG